MPKKSIAKIRKGISEQLLGKSFTQVTKTRKKDGSIVRQERKLGKEGYSVYAKNLRTGVESGSTTKPIEDAIGRKGIEIYSWNKGKRMDGSTRARTTKIMIEESAHQGGDQGILIADRTGRGPPKSLGIVTRKKYSKKGYLK